MTNAKHKLSTKGNFLSYLSDDFEGNLPHTVGWYLPFVAPPRSLTRHLVYGILW